MTPDDMEALVRAAFPGPEPDTAVLESVLPPPREWMLVGMCGGTGRTLDGQLCLGCKACKP